MPSSAPATTDIYTLSLHDALPILDRTGADHYQQAIITTRYDILNGTTLGADPFMQRSRQGKAIAQLFRRGEQLFSVAGGRCGSNVEMARRAFGYSSRSIHEIQLREIGKHRVVVPPVISRSEVAH